MIVTRFPPSPTGYLHVGSARVALYNWLWAKKNQGRYVLRIEDTDRERSTDEAVEVILNGLRWLGLDWNEGPHFQTHRFERYKDVIQALLDKGLAYRCTCSKERLEKLREEQMSAKLKPRYDGLCRDKENPDSGEYVIRFRNPVEGSVIFEDVIRGPIEVRNSELDDLIIARSDGTPTYNLTVVVDDLDMGMTHILRGDDHINNTPRQINLMKAIAPEAKVPVYGHMPMILGSDGKRLSKRHGAVSVLEYQAKGILPEALLNYLVRLGWSYKDQEIFSLEEMIEFFDIKDINKSPSAFNDEKLLWLNQHYMKTLPADRVARALVGHYSKRGIDIENGPSLASIIEVYAERSKTLAEMAESTEYLFKEISEYDAKAYAKFIKAETLGVLELARTRLNELKDWTSEHISATIKPLSDELGLGLGKIMQPIRIAVTGSTNAPSLDQTLVLVGKQRSIERIDAIIAKIKRDAA